VGDLTIDDFTGWVGRECDVTAPESDVRMTLVTAEPIAGSLRSAGGFRLEFLGPQDPLLAQAIMTVAGPDRTDDIFLVPVERDARGTVYEAVFF
jgi:hypothetical protein